MNSFGNAEHDTTSSYEQDFYSENEQYEGQKLNDNGRQQAHTIADTSKASK